MKINYGKTALILIIMGIVLFVINAVDVFLGCNKTHGKGFQIIGLLLMVIGIIVWMKSRQKLDKVSEFM